MFLLTTDWQLNNFLPQFFSERLSLLGSAEMVADWSESLPVVGCWHWEAVTREQLHPTSNSYGHLCTFLHVFLNLYLPQWGRENGPIHMLSFFFFSSSCFVVLEVFLLIFRYSASGPSISLLIFKYFVSGQACRVKCFHAGVASFERWLSWYP